MSVERAQNNTKTEKNVTTFWDEMSFTHIEVTNISKECQ
jgi:hypothetical protein